jgi:hypothetical protein
MLVLLSHPAMSVAVGVGSTRPTSVPASGKPA